MTQQELIEGTGGFTYPHETSTIYYHGLTLRDYFAGKAMESMLNGWPSDQDSAEISKRAYKLADSMIKEKGTL